MAPLRDEKFRERIEQEFKLYQNQKSRRVGGVERRVLQNLAMYVGEQWVWFENSALRNRVPKTDDEGRINEVNLVLNLIQPAFEDIYGWITASSPEFRAFPDDKTADKIAKAEVVSMAVRAANERLDEDYLRWQRWFWSMIGGWWVEHTPWRRDHHVDVKEKTDELGNLIWKHIASGEEMPEQQAVALIQAQQALREHFKPATEVAMVGDFGAEVRGPLNVFNPNSIRTLDDLQPGQSIMFADIRLLSWAKKTWPQADFKDIKAQENFKILTTTISEEVSFTNTSLSDLMPVVQGSAGINEEPKLLTIVERYEPPSAALPKGWSMSRDASTGRGFIPAPDESLANGGRYTVLALGQGILRDGELPYIDGIPATDGHWDVSAANFHNPDWCTRVNGIQKSINTLWSQIRMKSNARIFDPILMDGELTPPETDTPRFWPNSIQDGVRRAERLGGDTGTQEYVRQAEKLVEMFDKISGRVDLFGEKRFPGQIRGTGAIERMQDVMDSRWGPKLRHYYRQVSKVHHRRVNRMKQFYPPFRTLRLVDSQGQVEVFRFHTDEILRAGVDFYVTVEPSTILPETRGQRFSRMIELLNSPLQGLYLDQETGQLDWTAIAAELEYGDFKGREASVVREDKFARTIVDAIKEGRAVPPVTGIENHLIYLRVLKETMLDDDFWQTLSEPTRQALFDRYSQHAQALTQQQQQAQQAAIDEETSGIIREAVQQSLAKLQVEVTDAVLSGVRGLAQTDPQGLQALLNQPPESEDVF